MLRENLSKSALPGRGVRKMGYSSRGCQTRLLLLTATGGTGDNALGQCPVWLSEVQNRYELGRAFREYERPQRLLENTSSAHLGLQLPTSTREDLLRQKRLVHQWEEVIFCFSIARAD
jgi:hypothetical protein